MSVDPKFVEHAADVLRKKLYRTTNNINKTNNCFELYNCRKV